MENEAKKKPGCLNRLFGIIFIVAVIILIGRGCFSSSEAPSGLEDLYIESQEEVRNNLLCPATAVFPEFDKSFVSYDTSVLKDYGMGMLEYRNYDVKAYVDSQNAFGAMVRSVYWVKVSVYVDDYNTPDFGEKGIHKGIQDHRYITLMSLDIS